ncbi:MAG: trypsin-like serine peptidase [Chloroflexota bacterium]
MDDHVDTGDGKPRPVSLLDDLAAAVPVAATAEMPADLAAMLNPEKGVYIRAEHTPVLDVAVEPVPGARGLWRVVNRAEGQPLLTEIPGVDAEDLTKVSAPAVRRAREMLSTEGYRPPWSVEQLMPRLVPFRSGKRIYLETRAIEEGQRLNYPWRTVGIIFTSQGMQGSGVLVGPNLVLTAGHIAPWGQSPWSMEFVPAYRMGDRPYGSSFIQSYRGFNTRPEASGKDFVICKLYQPLGNAIGWMGTKSFGSEAEYYARSYLASGYPGHYGQRPAVELDLGIRDIDNDSPGLELETVNRSDLQAGWSGGPLWLPQEGPAVVGVLSGNEKDEFDPRRAVFAGGAGMVDLVKFGLANWRP